MKKFNRIGLLLFLVICGVFLINIFISDGTVEIESEITSYDIDFIPPIFDRSDVEKWEKLASLADINDNGIGDDFEVKLENSSEKLPVLLNFPNGNIEVIVKLFKSLGGEINHVYKTATNGFAGEINQENLLKFYDTVKQAEIPFLLEEDGICNTTVYFTTRNMNLRPYVWNNLALKGDKYSSIAIVDTGIDPTHNFFAPGYSNGSFDHKIVGWNDVVYGLPTPYEDHYHGTHCAGIAAGRGGPDYDEYNRSVYCDASGLNLTGRDHSYIADIRHLPGAEYMVNTPGTIEISVEFHDDTTNPDDVCLNYFGLYYLNQTNEVASFNAADLGKNFNYTLTYNVSSDALGKYRYKAFYEYKDNTGDEEVYEPAYRLRIISHWPFQAPLFECGDQWQGVAPEAPLVVVKVFPKGLSATDSDIVEGVEWIIENKELYNITTISMSLGSAPGVLVVSMIDAVNNAVENGLVTVVAAGNYGAAYGPTIGSPGIADNVITVASMNTRDQVTDYSSMGTNYTGLTIKPDIMAPGGSHHDLPIYSAEPNSIEYSWIFSDDPYLNDLKPLSGTSMATPAVAGATNLLIEAMSGHKNWNFTATEAKRVKALLLMTATETYPLIREASFPTMSAQLNRGGKDPHEGYGRINVDAAIEACTQELTLGSIISANLCSSTVSPQEKHALGCYVELSAGETYNFQLRVPQGADFDLHLYSNTPSPIGEPIMTGAGKSDTLGKNEKIPFTPIESGKYYLVAKAISGEGEAIISQEINEFAPTLTNGEVSSTSGNQKTLFDFSVTYTDQDNNAPITINTVINGVKYRMVKQNHLDLDYTDGCDYQFSTYLQPGIYNYSFECSDFIFDYSTTINTGLIISTLPNSHAPILEEGQVIPKIGFNGSTLFEYTVNYSDADNNEPESINVIINSTINLMIKQDFTDSNYMDGCVFVFSTTMDDFGNYIFHLNCSDGGYQVEIGPFTEPTIKPIPLFDDMYLNHSITFFDRSWGIYPSNILYTRISNDTYYAKWDDFIYGWDHKVNCYTRVVSNTEIYYSWYMTGDHTHFWIFPNISIGDIIPISTYPEGDHDYIVRGENIYYHEDGALEVWVLEDLSNPLGILWYEKSTGILINGTMAMNLEQMLSYTYDYVDSNVDFEFIPNNDSPKLSEIMILPFSGDQKTQYNFSVVYTDEDNNAPLFVNVIINGVTMQMEKYNSLDADYSNGCVYQLLTYLQPGKYDYYFECSDGEYDNTTEILSGFMVVEALNEYSPILNNGQVSPGVGFNDTSLFRFEVNYSDRDNNLPEHVNLTINGICYDMYKLNSFDTNYMDGCVYIYETTLDEFGTYEYNFSCSDGENTVVYAHFSGPIVQKSPLFDGMYINYTYNGHISSPWKTKFSYSKLSNGSFNATWELPSFHIDWTEDVHTRKISSYIWSDDRYSHHPFRIDRNVGIGDQIPIAIRLAGDQMFVVSEDLIHYIPGYGHVELWVLKGLYNPLLVAWFEKSTGILVKANYEYYYTMPYFPDYPFYFQYIMEITSTNVEFAYIENSIFDGMYSEYILDMEFYDSDQLIINHSFVGDDTFHVEWHRGNYSWLWYRVNNLTRIISSSYGMFLEGTHTPLWIQTCASIGDIIPISMLYEGDRLFNVTREDFYLSANGLVEIWILEDLNNPDLYAWYEKSTGLLIKGEFGYMMYGYDIWYSLNFIETNANFTYVPNEFAPELSDLTLIPSTGTQKTEFHFSVVYTDQDNSFPTYIDLIVDGMRVPMHKQNPADDDYTDGCIYECLLYLQPGTCNYSVECGDWKFNASSEVMTDLVVSESPNLNAPTLSNGYVSPEVGYNNTTIFEFFVTYADQDNDAPEFVKIILNSATHPMTKVDILDTNYMDGCLYKYEAPFDKVDTYSFSFMGFDGDFLTEIGPISGPEVKRSPLFSGMWINYTIISSTGSNQTIMLSYSHLSNNVFKARWDPYGDWTHWETDILTRLISNSTVIWALEGEVHTPFWIHTDVSIGDIIPVCVIYEGDHFFKVSGELIYYLEGKGFIEVWVLEDVSNPNNSAWYEKSTGILINCSNSISVPDIFGNMTYSFTFVDSNVDFQYATNLNPPELADIEVDPELGERYSTTFTYTVYYIDLDNDAPAFLNISISGINYAMIKSDPTDITYYDGCEYYYSTTFDILGAYTFQISTSDGKYSVLSEIYNFTVQDTTGPDLTVVSPVQQMYPDGSIVINVSSSAPDLCAFWYTLYWIEGEQWIGNPGGNLLEDGFGLLYLLEGKYIITIYANDTEGNVNSEALHFSVNVPIIPGYPTLVVIAISVLVIAGIVFRDYRRKKFGGNFTYICNHCGYRGKEEYLPRFCENCGGSFIYIPKIAEKQKYSGELKKPNLT